MNHRGDSDHLFFKYDMHGVMDHQGKIATTDVESIEADRLLNTPTVDLVTYFLDKHRLDVPKLHRDRAHVDQREAQVPFVDYWGLRDDDDRVQYVTGTRVELTVPFTGDGEMFSVRPTSFDLSPPIAKVTPGGIIITVSGRDMTPQHVQQQLNKTLDDIDKYLGWQRASADEFNDRLVGIIRNAIEARKKKLLADRNLVAGLGFPMKPRAGSPATYSAPEVRRKVQPLPPASVAPFKPEPVLDEANYKHILSVIDNMTVVMERSPTAFAEMGEEAIRQHYLVQLNGHFEGAATGETFNYQGKTDILIRVDGRNIFIAECKFWRGEKQFIETVDQILSYLSWRDTKAAIMIFNRNKEFSQVLAKIRDAANAHPHRKHGPEVESETRFRYVFGNPSDHSREIILTILAFDVPSPVVSNASQRGLPALHAPLRPIRLWAGTATGPAFRPNRRAARRSLCI